LAGRWERYDDEAEGTIVEIEEYGAVCHAKLVRVAGVLRKLNFSENDIKWRDIEPMGRNTWRGKDLIKEIDTLGNVTSVDYKDVYYTLINDSTMELRWFAKEQEFVGIVQKWRRVR
jgi:hypothetical protein